MSQPADIMGVLDDDERKYRSKHVEQPRNNKLSYTVASCWSFSYIVTLFLGPVSDILFLRKGLMRINYLFLDTGVFLDLLVFLDIYGSKSFHALLLTWLGISLVTVAFCWRT